LTTVTAAFARTVARQGNEIALRAPAGDGFRDLTWTDYADAACRVAAGLRALGLRPGERVALMLRNRPEFHVVDLGVLLAGGTPVSIYNSSPPERVAYVAGHAGARLAVVEDVFSERFAAARACGAGVDKVVTVGEGGDLALDDLVGAAPLDLDAAAAQVRPEDLVTVIYTSGTTGDPKGVMLTHANLDFTVGVYGSVLGRSLQGLRQVSYLPMAHIAERLATHYFHVTQGSVVTTCADLVADLGRLMVAVQPEWFFGAPRLWEKLQAGINAVAGADTDRAEAFAATRRLGWRAFLARRDQGTVDEALAKEWADVHADQVAPVLQRVGLGGVVIALTGAAPMPRHTSEFFLSLGVPLSEVWGMSETAGTGTWSPHRIMPGTAGRPVPGLDVRLGDGDEILVKGPCVFAGYLDDPQRTAEVLDADGWLHTGDVGRFDGEGNLSIVDRIKDILVPSSGHNVSPAQLEALLMESPLVGQACVVGDGKPHVAALLVLDPEMARAWAAAHGVEDSAPATLAGHPELRAEIGTFVEEVNQRLPRAERIVTFAVVGDEWLPDSDVLTPTAKLKRRAVQERYAENIDALYA
jgi:long-chain acyl-CoA synthetase